MKFAAAFAALFLFCATSRAGDAVAVGYNDTGVWVAATYYCSSTPKGGADYKSAAAAAETALRDLHRRSGSGIVREQVIASSDRTGYFAVTRATNSRGRDAIEVGYGASPSAAERDALTKLERRGARANPKVMYRYFSHGADGLNDR